MAPRKTRDTMQRMIDRLYGQGVYEIVGYTGRFQPCHIKCYKCGHVTKLKQARYLEYVKERCECCAEQKAPRLRMWA